MTLKYVAIDGTEFDDEEECYNYERTINTVRSLVPELFVSENLKPLSLYFHGYFNDCGYLINEKQCTYENFIIRNRDDVCKIINALKDLGYNTLSENVARESYTLNYPEILCIMKIRKHDNKGKYAKYAFLKQQMNYAKRIFDVFNSVLESNTQDTDEIISDEDNHE